MCMQSSDTLTLNKIHFDKTQQHIETKLEQNGQYMILSLKVQYVNVWQNMQNHCWRKVTVTEKQKHLLKLAHVSNGLNSRNVYFK